MVTKHCWDQCVKSTKSTKKQSAFTSFTNVQHEPSHSETLPQPHRVSWDGSLQSRLHRNVAKHPTSKPSGGETLKKKIEIQERRIQLTVNSSAGQEQCNKCAQL